MTEMYHFHGPTLRDGSLVPPIGVRLVHDGPLVICKAGFHASPRIIDALKWAPGNILDGVILSGERIDERDKSVARERTRVWSLDAEALLREFARWAALHVIRLWTAPPIIVEYLTTGDPKLRDDAWIAAAEAAAKAAEWAAARAAGAARADAAAWAVEATWAAARAARAAAAARDAQEEKLQALVATARMAERAEDKP